MRRSNQGGRWLLPTHPPSSVVFQGDTPWNPWQRGSASLHAPLGGRRDYAIGGTSSIPPASGVAPLWTPRLHVLGGTPRLLPEGGTHWTPACSTRRSNQGGRWLLPTHPPSSAVFQGEHPLEPLAKRLCLSARSVRRQACLCYRRHILLSSCQWGCTPLDSPLTCAGGHPRSPVIGRRALDSRSCNGLPRLRPACTIRSPWLESHWS